MKNGMSRGNGCPKTFPPFSSWLKLYPDVSHWLSMLPSITLGDYVLAFALP
jgi:hypothetical protein